MQQQQISKPIYGVILGDTAQWQVKRDFMLGAQNQKPHLFSH